MVKILVVEDEPIIMQDIADYLQSLGYEVHGKAYTAKKAIEILDKKLVDLALLDINLNDVLDGIQIGEQIRDNYKIPFIYLTSYADQGTLARVKRTKPAGYIVKPFEEKDLFAAIELALFNHQAVSSPDVLSKVTLGEKLNEGLTEKELVILWNLYEGMSNQQIADTHYISKNTVKTHVSKIYDKLDVHSRSELMVKLRAIS